MVESLRNFTRALTFAAALAHPESAAFAQNSPANEHVRVLMVCGDKNDFFRGGSSDINFNGFIIEHPGTFAFVGYNPLTAEAVLYALGTSQPDIKESIDPRSFVGNSRSLDLPEDYFYGARVEEVVHPAQNKQFLPGLVDLCLAKHKR